MSKDDENKSKSGWKRAISLGEHPEELKPARLFGHALGLLGVCFVYQNQLWRLSAGPIPDDILAAENVRLSRSFTVYLSPA